MLLVLDKLIDKDVDIGIGIYIGGRNIKLGIGIIGSSVGSMFESSYGFKLGNLPLRVGVRYAKVLTAGSDVKEAFVVEPETLNWMDGLVAVGISL